jgi:uncharacterized protein (TIGR03437 family)
MRELDTDQRSGAAGHLAKAGATGSDHQQRNAFPASGRGGGLPSVLGYVLIGTSYAWGVMPRDSQSLPAKPGDLEVNITVPSVKRSGDVPIVLTVGGKSTQAGAMLTVATQ